MNVLGTSFRSELEAEIDLHQLPERIGGNYSKPTEPFEFDYHTENSLLWTPPRDMIVTSPTTPTTE